MRALLINNLHGLTHNFRVKIEGKNLLGRENDFIIRVDGNKMVMKVKAPWKRSTRNNKLKSVCYEKEREKKGGRRGGKKREAKDQSRDSWLIYEGSPTNDLSIDVIAGGQCENNVLP